MRRWRGGGGGRENEKAGKRVKKVDLAARSTLLVDPWGSAVVRFARSPIIQSPRSHILTPETMRFVPNPTKR